MKPSNYMKHPYDSVFQNNESETIARNIMVILARTGNTWRDLTWDEYATERQKDGGSVLYEYSLFNKVIGYCKSPDTAKLFSPAWKFTI
jgi:hypothetical protein